MIIYIVKNVDFSIFTFSRMTSLFNTVFLFQLKDHHFSSLFKSRYMYILLCLRCSLHSLHDSTVTRLQT